MATTQITTAIGTKQAVTRAKLSLVAMDAEIVLIRKDNPKTQSDSRTRDGLTTAYRNYPLYAKIVTNAKGEPLPEPIEPVTVGAFLKHYPVIDGGRTRARASILWDMEHGFISVSGYTREDIAAATKA